MDKAESEYKDRLRVSGARCNISSVRAHCKTPAGLFCTFRTDCARSFPLSTPLYFTLTRFILLPLHYKKATWCISRAYLPTHTAQRRTEIDAACDDICGWEKVDGLLIFQSLWAVLTSPFIHVVLQYRRRFALHSLDSWVYVTCIWLQLNPMIIIILIIISRDVKCLNFFLLMHNTTPINCKMISKIFQTLKHSSSPFSVALF